MKVKLFLAFILIVLLLLIIGTLRIEQARGETNIIAAIKLTPAAERRIMRGLEHLIWLRTNNSTESDYKAFRAKEITDMAKRYGLGDYKTKLVAHLLTENGALAEDRHGDSRDGGKTYCSLGIIMWNTCAHYGMNVEKYLTLNPKMKDWRTQINFYLSEMQWRLKDKGNIDAAIASWNPGSPGYLSLVNKKVPQAVALLQ